jgi:thiamine biosynthesis lipoprotein
VAAVPAAARRRRVVRRAMPAMGTIVRFAVVHRDERYAHAAIDAAFAALAGVERDMTRFTATSDIGRVNLGAAAGPVPVTARTAFVIEEALRWAEATDGRYDPAVGSIIRLWDVTHRQAPPPEERVRALAGRRLHRAVEVTTHGGRPAVVLHDADAQLDLGAIAKGYGVDCAVAELREWGITDAIVGAGGDIYAMGNALDGEPWRVGIRDPLDPGRVAAMLALSNRAVSTSGDYEQYFRWRGRRYHHLLDPHTAAPRRTRVHSGTITADRCMTSDVASTTLFGLDPRDADHLIRRRAVNAQHVRNL